jgi:hypothetical protein
MHTFRRTEVPHLKAELVKLLVRVRLAERLEQASAPD